MKPTDMQAAIGVAQLERAHEFTSARRSNFDYLKQRFMDMELFNYFILRRKHRAAMPRGLAFRSHSR